MARLFRETLLLNRSIRAAECYREKILGTSSQICYFSSKAKKKVKNRSDSGDKISSDKDLALQQAVDKINASFGKDSIMRLGRSSVPRHVPVASTGLLALDMALGIGGLPKGRVVEISGPEDSGKTTIALHVIAEAQKRGGYCVFVDAENALDSSFAESIGVDTESLLLTRPDTGEQALSLVDTLIRSRAVDVVVVDNVAALVPKDELDGEMGGTHIAMQARLMSQVYLKLTRSLSDSQAILIFTNQTRPKSIFEFGRSNEVTSGGNALNASVRLNVRRIGLIRKGEETIGSQVQVKIVKNKHAPPFKTALFELEFGKGISCESELIDLGCEHKFVSNAGSFYSFNGQSFHGKDALKNFLAENESIREELTEKLRKKVINTKRAETSDEPNEEETVLPDTIEENLVATLNG